MMAINVIALRRYYCLTANKGCKMYCENKEIKKEK